MKFGGMNACPRCGGQILETVTRFRLPSPALPALDVTRKIRFGQCQQCAGRFEQDIDDPGTQGDFWRMSDARRASTHPKIEMVDR